MSQKNLLNLGVFAGLIGLCGSAEAQISRFFVSVTGNDGNNCINLDTPCRTIAGGIAQVDAKGEVIIIATGSYAGGTITKEVKINAAPGIVAFSGLPFVIDPGLGNTVVLRGLTVKAATPGGFGVTLTSGILMMENCVVDGWSIGILATGSADPSSRRLVITDSVIRNNAIFGMQLGFLTASVTNTYVTNNGTGMNIAGDGASLTLSHSVVFGNSGIGIWQNSLAILRVMGNNVVEGNGTDTSGTITTGTLK